ncbi:hypothetical protein C8R46DRAFT_311450 [Mycena filopes]|nr:hypothetical protein C8R46DRAFT_311450 [Mycena filopes]
MFNAPQEFTLFSHQDGSEAVDLGTGHQDSSTASASMASYGRQLGMAITHGHTQPRAFSRSPQPTYSHPAVGNDYPVQERHSDADILPPSSTFDEPNYSTSYNAQHFGLIQIHDGDRAFTSESHNIEHADGASSEPCYTGGIPMWAAAAEQFEMHSGSGSISTHSSPGYIEHELPDATRRAVGHARHYSSDHFDHVPSNEFPYRDNGFGRPAQLGHNNSLPQSAMNTWRTEPTGSANPTPASFQTPTPAHLFNAFGHHPPLGGSRRVPQMFKLTTTTGRRRHPGKKQPLSCLFCRERKIKCLQPAEDEPDQTCNQCARRDRTCQYPTESRRGQHNRTRLIPRKSPSAEGSSPATRAT